MLLVKIGFLHSTFQFSYSFSKSIHHQFPFLLRLLREIHNRIFLLSWGVSQSENFPLKGQDFNPGLLPHTTCFHHSFQSVVYRWFDFGLSFCLGSCNQAQWSLLPYLIDAYDWVHQTPCSFCSATHAAEGFGLVRGVTEHKMCVLTVCTNFI